MTTTTTTAYRTTPDASPVRTCVIGGVRTPALLGVAFLPMLFAALVFSTREDVVECDRDGQNDRCIVGTASYPIKDVVGLDLETQGQDSKGGHLYKLVFVTRQSRVSVDHSYSSYMWDHRPELVKDFDAFLGDANAKHFPKPWMNLKTDIAVAILMFIGLGLTAQALRRRGMAVLEVNDAKGTLTITRDMTPPTAFRMVRTIHQFELSPVPVPMIEDESKQTYLSLSHGHEATLTKLIEAPVSTVARAKLMNRITAFLSDPAAS